MSFFQKLKALISPETQSDYDQGFKETEKTFGGGLKRLFGWSPGVDESFYQELTHVLIASDVGQKTTADLVTSLKKRKPQTPQDAVDLLSQDILARFQPYAVTASQPITVYLMVGVNGSGKTTSTAKLASRFKMEGKKVMVVAADTFRAAAVAQLKIWAERLDIRCVYGKENADPASVVVDACRSAQSEGYDTILIDTAGRLQNKLNLMAELEKIHRVIEKTLGYPAQHVFLVLDASTGQNAISQAQAFLDSVKVTGIVCTKMDGTAKGGSLIALATLLKLPVTYIGLGEKVEDLKPFDAQAYLAAITKELDDVG